MEKVTHGRIIGIDVSRDWLDIHCLPDGQRHRILNSDDGHVAVSDLAHDQRAVVCFEATGGQEWRLWFHLEDAGVETRQVPPAQVKAFARSLGTRAKTDRIDAELIARLLVFRPEAGRAHPAEHLRLLRALTRRMPIFQSCSQCLHAPRPTPFQNLGAQCCEQNTSSGECLS